MQLERRLSFFSKFLVTGIFFLAIGQWSFAQCFSYQWATNPTGPSGDAGHSIATDAAGNVYVAGDFDADSLVFGPDTTFYGLGMFLVKYDATGNFLWGIHQQGTGGIGDNLLDIDPFDNVYLSGHFGGDTIIWGTDTLVNQGVKNIYLVKFDASGNVLWAQSFGGNSVFGDYATALSTDQHGNAYLAGTFNSSPISFGATTLTNAQQENMFVAKFDANGNDQWVTPAAGSGDNVPEGIAADSSGHVYVTGYFESTVMNAGMVNLTSTSTGDWFTLRLNPDGTPVWGMAIPSDWVPGLAEQEAAVAIDGDQNIIVAGSTKKSSIQLGGVTLTNTTTFPEAFVAKLDSNGNVFWAVDANGRESHPYSLAIDAQNNIYVGGVFASFANAWGSLISTSGGYDLYLTKIDFSGNILWATKAGGGSLEGVADVAIDPNGAVLATGWFASSSITFGSFTLSNTNANSEAFVAKLNVPHTIQASFTHSNVLQQATFTNTSTNALAYQWDLGDGSSDTVVNPIHDYLTGGDFVVCLDAWNACEAERFCDTVTIPCPIVQAGFGVQVASLVATFSDSTVYADSVFWDFGDGQTGTGFNPVHGYPMTGTYLACQYVFNDCTIDSVCDTVVIACAPPISQFAWVDSFLKVSYYDSSMNSFAFSWDLGDGTVSNQQNPVHVYAAPGTYNVCLETSNLCGRDTLCQAVIINCATPNASFIFQDSALTVSFSDSSTGLLAISWDFGDGSGSNLQHPTHTYGAPGTYTVCLVASNFCGNDTLCQQVTVACQGPTASFNTAVNDLNVTFTSNSILADTYIYDFGDGFQGFDPTSNHTYANYGTYVACLYVTNACGADTLCDTLELVCQGPVAAFATQTSSLVVDFNDNSINATSWHWDFGDGNSDTQQNPLHTYSADGIYNVCLIVNNDCRADTICDSVTVEKITGMDPVQPTNIAVNPNPAQDQVVIQVQQHASQPKLTLTLFDLLGQQVQQITLQQGSNLLTRNDLPAGIYWYRITDNNHTLQAGKLLFD